MNHLALKTSVFLSNLCLNFPGGRRLSALLTSSDWVFPQIGGVLNRGRCSAGDARRGTVSATQFVAVYCALKPPVWAFHDSISAPVPPPFGSVSRVLTPARKRATILSTPQGGEM